MPLMPTRRRGRPPVDDVLTPAEWRTVHAVQHGLTNRQIAERRGISVDAVKYHVANALEKLCPTARERDRPSFPEQALRDGEADPGAGTGDDGDPIAARS